MSRENYQGASVSLGKLKVGKQIGAGGFGVVHEGELSGVGFPFAIKFLNPSPFASDASKARERFFREAELLLKLRHPHIISIFGIGEHEERPYILMERFRGVPVHQARESGPPSPSTLLPFVELIVGALGHAHSKGVVHRDIKPSNLMTVRGDARVLDFGIAGLLDPDGSRLTRTGGTLVGDAYSAPELTENPRLIDPRCDVYSVGACWFWLLTGKAPKGVDWQGALRGLNGVSQDYQRVVLRCLAQVETRYPTMDQLLADVRALRAGGPPALRPDDLSDDDARVLGVVAASCPLPGDLVSIWTVEKELARTVNKLSLAISNRKLLRLNLLEKIDEQDFNGNTTPMLRLTSAGEAWIETHHVRVASLMPGPKATPIFEHDDVPF